MFNWLKNLEYGVGFVEGTNIYTESLLDFYNLICVYLIIICVLISFWIIFILKNYTFKREALINNFNLGFILKDKLSISYYVNINLKDRAFSYIGIYDCKDYPVVEGSWCVVPLGFVSTVSYPSIGLEYGISPDITPAITVKVLANQWFWVFDIEAKVSPTLGEADGYFFAKSDAYKLFEETYGNSEEFFERLSELDYQVLQRNVQVNLINSDPNFFRLLSVDNKIVLPINTPIQLIITSMDVLHSFAVPSLGIKIDAVPGRLSEQVIVIDRPGLYWGQCSELCGPYHGYMPIIIEGACYANFFQSFFIDIK